MKFSVIVDGVLLAEEGTLSEAIQTAFAGRDLDPTPKKIVIKRGEMVMEISGTPWIEGRQPWLYDDTRTGS